MNLYKQFIKTVFKIKRAEFNGLTISEQAKKNREELETLKKLMAPSKNR